MSSRIALLGLCAAGACASTDLDEGPLAEVCDLGDEVSTLCKAQGGSTGFSCFGTLEGTCDEDAQAAWERAWACIRGRCEAGENQVDAERACANEGKPIPEECGTGIGSVFGGDGGI